MRSSFDRTDPIAVQFIPVDDARSSNGLRLDRFVQTKVLKAMLPDGAQRFACSTSNLTVQ